MKPFLSHSINRELAEHAEPNSSGNISGFISQRRKLLSGPGALRGKYNRMKILLIQPPVRDFYQTPIRTQPIGLAYLAAALEQTGCDVEILDCQVTDQKKSIPVPERFSGITEFYPRGDLSPFRLYSGYHHFGLSYEEIKERIKQSSADVIGISSQFTPYCEEACYHCFPGKSD